MNELTGYLEKLGSNFLVSAMVPSFAVVVLGLVVFDPILGASALFVLPNSIYQLIGISSLLLIPTVIIGFTLTALNTYILKIFEGYVLFDRVPFMLRSHQKKAIKLIQRKDTLNKRIETVERLVLSNQANQYRSIRMEKTLDKLKRKYFVVSLQYDSSYPPDYDSILPTKFGNILKAAEMYSGDRYGLDGVIFWPRLWGVIPPDYKNAIDGSRNELSFLVNMAVLSVAFFGLCVFAILYNFIATASISTGVPTNFIGFGYTFRYFFVGLIALALAFFFNKASLFLVGDFGNMIRSSYDLFRFDLLEKFRLKLPINNLDEYKKWRNLNELVALGQASLDFTPIGYEHPKTK